MAMISVVLALSVSDQLCKDLLTTCVEGGSGYWLAAQDYVREPDPNVNVVKIIGCFDREDESTKFGDATLDTMREGIRRLLSREVKVNDTTYLNLLKTVVDEDNCNWDADDADAVLQAGLLNDITYG